MISMVDWSIEHRRSILLLLLFLFVGGIASYNEIPKESEPDIPIPYIYVSMSHEGISPLDAERLLIRPMEKELKGIEGVKEMTAKAIEGHASVTLEFDAGFDSELALQDVREKVDIAKVKLPDGGDEPSVHEVNVALFPIMTLSLSGSIPERQLIQIARKLREDLESLSGVLEVDIGGDREEVLEVIVDPLILDTYEIQFEEVLNIVQRNNRLVAAGAIDGGQGRMVVKVPGVIEDLEDIRSLPIKMVNGKVVSFEEIASIKSTFKDPDGFARVNGEPAIALEIKKRVGENIIETTEQVRAVVDAQRQFWPEGLKLTYITDKSNQIMDMLGDLQNNVSSAILLVMIVIIGVLGVRSSILVGLAIPASFLTGIFIINQFGLTLNIVVLFSLILVVGMLVDGAIVVTELASRNMDKGLAPDQAFAAASKRMAWPIIASTLTTLAVFMPLIAWPGVVGEFMKFLPITVIICLSASLFVALVFLPVLGSWIGRRQTPSSKAKLPQSSTMTTVYSRWLSVLLAHPALTLLFTVLFMFGVGAYFAKNNHGVEFFPDIEPETMKILVHSRGDQSIYQKDSALRQVEKRLLGMDEFESIYARSFNQAQDNVAEDVVGSILIQLKDWDKRRPASEILEELTALTEDIPGIKLEFRKEENGPSGGKPIVLQVGGIYSESIDQTADDILDLMRNIEGLKDIEDDRPLPGIEWRVEVNRIESARYGADIALVGGAIQMVTAGLKVSEFRPDHTDEEVDIIIRFPEQERYLEALNRISITTAVGLIPLSNFVELVPSAKTGTINRADGRRVVKLQADVEPGFNVAERLSVLRDQLDPNSMPADVRIQFKGEDADQKETGEFLANAFMIAIFMMFLILVTQFNSFYQGILILSAIVFSSVGVLIGLLVTAQPFGIVMVGLGIIALAGIVVNNNIVLIDTYNVFINSGLSPEDAALKTGELRMRPVLLTAGTTVLGLLPMVLAMNIDFINREIAFGAPSTQWWTQLSSAIAGGLTFATVLTLFLTPALLVLGAKVNGFFKRKKRMILSENDALESMTENG